MHDESFDHFWRQEMLFVYVKLAEQINLDSTIALLVWQLGQLTEKHEAEEGQLLVLMMENV